MINIDQYAYTSKLINIDPRQKIFFALLTMGVCLWANSIIVSVLVLLIMVSLVVFKGGTPVMILCKLLLVPMSFLVLGVMTIAVNLSTTAQDFMFFTTLGGMAFGVTKTGLQNALVLFLKALSAISCLYYLSLTTPMIEVLAVLHRYKVPKLLVEIMGLIYRFIFVFLETGQKMVTAQNSRLGYASFSAGYRSMGALFSTLFIRAYKRSDDLYTALEARGYEGQLNVLQETTNSFRWPVFSLTIALNFFLVILALI